MRVDDEAEAIKTLSTISYYRLSGYWYLFRERNANQKVQESFEPNTRLWNPELAIHPDAAKELEWRSPITPRSDRVFYVLLMICHMLNRINSAQEWMAQVEALLEPVCQSTRWQMAMGVPPHWREHPIWNSCVHKMN